MSYFSQSDLEGIIGKDAMLACFDDDGNGFINQTYFAECQSLSDADVDGGLARVYPGPFPVFQVIPAWTASTSYSVGQMVIPTAPTGYAFRCVGLAGESGAVQPTWPAQYGVTVADGAVTWLCVSTVPELIRHASLLYGRAHAYERSPEYTRRYGSRPREQAEAYMQRLVQAEEYLSDYIGSPQPANVGGYVYAQGPRMTVDQCGQTTTGDF